MEYNAFISYSHAADGRLAPAVQAGLARLTKPWWKLRALNVFRDETGLAVDPHMWRSIQSALDESSWFVLLASPDAASSQWVNREIEHWLVSKPADRILPVLTDGSIRWDDAASDFTGDSTAIPPALRSAYEAEPRYLDLRWARSADDLDLRHPRFKAAVATLAAPLHGVAPEQLETEDVRAHRRARRAARTAVAALVLLTAMSVTSTTVAWNYAAQARAENRARQKVAACNATADAAKAAAAAFYADVGHFPRTFTELTKLKPPVLSLQRGTTIAILGVTGMPKSAFLRMKSPSPHPMAPDGMFVGVFAGPAGKRLEGTFYVPKPITRPPKGATITKDFIYAKDWTVTMEGGGSTNPTMACTMRE